MASSDVCLILYHNAAFGIDEAEKAMPSNLVVERFGDVLHVRWDADDDVVLQVRAVTGISARDGRVLWDGDLPEEVERFPRAFEISFDDLEEVLQDAINTLIDVQVSL